jgi:hypothetical protein
VSRCTDCGGGVPAPLWKRCEEHALARLRTMMGGAPPPSVIARRFKIGTKVHVFLNGEKLPGRVARCPQGDDYVIDLDRGGRAYVTGNKLSEP